MDYQRKYCQMKEEMLTVSKRRIKRITVILVSVIKISGKYCGDYACLSYFCLLYICSILHIFLLGQIYVFLLAATRMTQRDLARAIIHTNGQQLQCRMPIKITIETDCSPTTDCHPSSSRIPDVTRDYKRKNGSKRGKRCEIDTKELQTSLPSWKSEYQDSISKIGHAIMHVKLHHAKRKAFPFQYQQCISN